MTDLKTELLRILESKLLTLGFQRVAPVNKKRAIDPPVLLEPNPKKDEMQRFINASALQPRSVFIERPNMIHCQQLTIETLKIEINISPC